MFLVGSERRGLGWCFRRSHFTRKSGVDDHTSCYHSISLSPPTFSIALIADGTFEPVEPDPGPEPKVKSLALSS